MQVGAYELGGEGGNVTDPEITRVRNSLDLLSYYLLILTTYDLSNP